MKKVSIGVVLVVALLALANCKTSNETIIPENNSSANVEVDSLDQLRLNLVDSLSAIKKPKNVKKETFTNPSKTVKKKVIVD
ncbi:MAG: hypothetical protein ACJASQ_001344 [Crocinitomicaceae bacterium]|jgi:hypothetical protein